MYRTIGKIIAITLVLAIALLVVMFIASSKKGDDTITNGGISTTSTP